MTSSTSRPQASLDEVAHLALRIGRLLFTSGADTAETVARIERLAADLGVSIELDVSAERLLLTVRSGESYRTKIGHPLTGAGVDMQRLAALGDVMAALSSGQIALAEAERRIAALETAGPLYPRWLAVPAVAMTTACLARLFGAEWAVVSAAFLAGAVSTLLRRTAAIRELNPIAGAFLLTVTSGLFGALLLKGAPDTAPALCLVAAGMILVPGVPLINGISDIANGHPGVGLARLATGTATVVAIGFGLFVAGAIAGDTLPVAGTPQSLPVLQDLVISGLAAIGYAVLFSVPPRAIWLCVLCGMAGHGGRTALEAGGVEIAAATLIAAAIAGALAVAAGRWLRLPWTAFAFPGVVAMVPGSYAFRAALGALSIMVQGAEASASLVAGTLALGIAAIVMTAAIAAGLLLASAGSRWLTRLVSVATDGSRT